MGSVSSAGLGRGFFAALVLAGCLAPSEPKSASSSPDSKTASSGADELEAAASVPIRRLSRTEYDNSVRDLLGDDSHPANAFPPDESVGGFESNAIAPVTGISVERYMDAAEALALKARARIDTLAPCPSGQSHDACAGRFIDGFGRRIYRRPLDTDERTNLLGLFTEKDKGGADYAGGIQLVLAVMLQSPQFLYRAEPASADGKQVRKLDGYEVATRLSYFVWASTPDDALLDEAAAGKLDTVEGVERAARRLLADKRASDGIQNFHRQWLELAPLETDSKDAALFPAYNAELKQAMVEETMRFSSHAVLEGGDTIKTLLTSHQTFVNASLAKLYGVPAPASGFALVSLPDGQRSGILTHASVLAVHANADQTSPILRGKFIREKLLCEEIPPPPPNAMFTAPKVDPSVTTKERFAKHRTDPSCAGCHQMMDPVGFGFEHYDAIGSWRSIDGKWPVDATGEVTTSEGAPLKFDGALELGARLADYEQVRRCIAKQWFQYAMGRPDKPEDKGSLDSSYKAFADKGFDVRELMVGIAKSDAFRHTGPGNAEPARDEATAGAAPTQKSAR